MPYSDDNDNSKIGDVQSAIAAGAALGDPRTLPETPAPTGFYTVVPEDYKIESLEQFMSSPLRIEQTVELHDAASFIEYVDEFGNPEVSRIFFDQEHERFEVIIDYHGGNGAPGWCEHVAGFVARRSEEFKAWMAQNKKQMTQVDFARFLEDNLPDIVEPEGATLLEIALTFEAKKDVEFASGVRLQTGQIQFTYNEVVRGAAQKGTLDVPEQFILGIPIHVGGPAYRIPVRFRWRLHEGKAVFWYEIVRPHRFVEDALKEIRERIAQATGLDVLAGVAK
ncbi:MAG: YfdQ family protein [Acidobacteriia bacterium]|nr:YfdQ family protein [Terriglobia bacterium]